MKQYFLPVIAGLIILLIWEFIVKTFHIEQWILPSPTQIINSFLQSRSLIFYHLIPTVVEAIIGLSGATLVSVFIAIVMERFQIMRKIILLLIVIVL